MSRRANVFAASIIALTTALGAHAQISASGPLTQVDPWGVGWVGARNGGLGSDLWTATHADDVELLYGSIDVNVLTPAQEALVRAIVLSGGRTPEGDTGNAMLQRIRLLRQLGEERKAVDIHSRFPNEAWSEDPAKFDADLDLASGDNKRACASAQTANSEDPYWQSVRATCYALAGSLDAAQLSAEFAVSSGVEDPWLLSAVSAAVIADADTRPTARFGNGVETALSIQGKLPPGNDTFVNLTPERALLIADRPDAPDLLKMRALITAARAGAISPDKARRALVTPKPADATENTLRTPLETAVDTVADPTTDVATKAKALVDALSGSRNDIRAFKLHTKVLLPEIKAIPIKRETALFAPSYVEIALAAEDLELAKKWRAAMDNPFDKPPVPEPTQAQPASGPQLLVPQQPAPTPEPIVEETSSNSVEILPPVEHSEWDKVRLDSLIALSSDDASNAVIMDISRRLMSLPIEQQAGVVQILSAFSGLGYPLSAEARTLLSDEANSRGFSHDASSSLSRINACLRAGAKGEAMMRALLLSFQEQGREGNPIVMADTLGAISRAGLKDQARGLALEMIAPWGAVAS